MFGYHVSDLQNNDVTVTDGKIAGTLKYIDEGSLADTWGAGNFVALKFTDLDADAVSVKVGLDPSQGSGLVEIIDDPDKNGAFKVTNKNTQKFKVVQETEDGRTLTQTFDLSELVLETASNEEPEG